MSRYKAYPSYKETRHSWLESVPAHWKMLPLKFLTAQHVTDGPHETPEFIDEGVPFLSVDGIQNNQLVFEGCRYISREDHARYSIKCKPNQGDVLLGKAASVGKVAHVDTDIEFNVWSPLAVIRPRSEKTGRFIYYSLQSALLQLQCDMYSNANTQKNLGMSTIDNLAFASPTDDEAEQVANFLDHETAKIDALIEKQQRLIELLREKRQAVISHAVTKGLNPNAPMKDSGVEWLGEVPEHWALKNYRYATQIYRGKFGHRPRNDPAFYDGIYPFIQTGDVAQAGKRILDYKQTLNERGKAVSQKFPAGTLVMAIAANIGDTAWVAHQLSSLYKADGKKQFDSVIVVTDRTVLDAQLQDTIYQFEHTDGVVGRINNKEGDGSKSEKLAGALESAQPIIIVTIQTFPHVLKAIENSVSLKERCYAIIADEAHSSQSGSTARQLKEVLMKEAGDDTEELDSDDIIAATVAARRASGNLSYFAFTATPKPKTLELFGRVPRPDEVASPTPACPWWIPRACWTARPGRVMSGWPR